MAVTQAMLDARRRLLEDFEVYAKFALKVRTKDGDIRPFVLNEAQQRLLHVINEQYAETGKVRIIILKARQMGLSTAVGGRIYSRVSQRRAKKALVVTHHADSTRALFDMTRRFHEQCPEALRPETRYSSRRELQFSALDSAYAVATAGGDSVGRGETFTHAHLSELAIWDKGRARDIFNGLMQAIPNAPDTEVYIESTANGVSGLFYEQWQAAMAGKSGFIPIFLPWFIQQEYREPVPPDFQRTPEEKELVRLYGLDDQQLMFRRIKIVLNGPELFRQEYPSTAEEAFLTTGRPVFHPDRINDMMRDAKTPIERMALEGDEFHEHPRGELFIYRKPEATRTYYVGADVGSGTRKDYSVAQVFDDQRRQVAVWRSDQVEPGQFGRVLSALGHLFNEAEVICERNNHGILTNRVLTKYEGYPNYFTETVYDKIADTETTHIGFFTSEKSKSLIINELRENVRQRDIEIVDLETLKEMRSFVVTETGRMEGEAGTHDDCVIALSLCNHINAGPYTPIVNEDAWYGQIE